MKKILYAAALLLGVCFLFRPGILKAATPKDLDAGKVYRLDLNGDGTKEKLRIVKKYHDDYSVTVKVQVNGKTLYKKTKDSASARLTICDLCTADKKKDICIQYVGDSDGLISFEAVRYTGKGIKKINGFQEFANDNLSAYRVEGIYRLDGKKRFYYVVDTPCYNDYFGCYFIDVPGCIRKNTFQIKTEDSYAISTYKNGMEQHVYTLAMDMNVYSTPDVQSVQENKISNGTQFYALRVQKANYDVNDNALWVQIQTIDGGMSGWLYFPSHGGLEAPALVNMPAWG